jgi:flotillin
VSFEKGIFIIPILHQYEFLDITMKTFSVDLSGHDAIVLENGLKIDVKVVFYVRISNTREDVLKVARTIGCDRASKTETIKELFYIKFSEMIKDVATDLGLNSKDKTRFRETLLHTIGADLNGFVLDDCAIEFLKVTEQSLTKG